MQRAAWFGLSMVAALSASLPLSLAVACSARDGSPRSGGNADGGASDGAGASDNSGGATSGGSSNGGSNNGGNGGSSGTSNASLADRVSVSQVTVPEGVKAGVANWRIWGLGPLGVAPVFIAPRSDCTSLVCYTVGSGGAPQARVAHLDADDQLVEVYELGAFECRGLAVEPDGHFGVLLWDDAQDEIFVQRYSPGGAAIWGSATALVNSDNHPTDFGIGDSRLEYGDGRYGAYYHVHSDTGHEGDTLKWVNATSGAESTSWAWGCSHSMSNLLRFNPGVDKFLPACVTDCYPGTSGDFSSNSIGGIYLNHQSGKVLDLAAGCNGSVAGELGGAALTPNGWALVFNTHQAPTTPGQSSYNSSMNQDIGFATVSANYAAGGVVWLTDTPSKDEADATIARWQPSGESTEQYLVGWTEENGAVYWLTRTDGAGTTLEGPVDVSGTARWGRRDDPFRVAKNGDVIWATFERAGSTTLEIGRIDSGNAASCP